MEKILSVILILVVSVSLVACGGASTQSNTEKQTAKQTTAEGSTEELASQADNKPMENKVLVVYFSNTGNTKNIAQSIASGLSADTYEIVAQNPYTSEDLNYNDSNSRSTKEMNDSSVRPAISGTVENMNQYTTIFIGYPIWWGEAPRILSTFVESYDFTGKTIVPFCTSSSSGLGSSARNLGSVAGTGRWLDGKRFSGNESSNTVMDWVNGLDIK